MLRSINISFKGLCLLTHSSPSNCMYKRNAASPRLEEGKLPELPRPLQETQSLPPDNAGSRSTSRQALFASAQRVGQFGGAAKNAGVSVFKDFSTFISRGNVIDLAVAVVMGTAFTAIVNSLVKDIITPLIALAANGVNFENLMGVLKAGKTGSKSYPTPLQAQQDGAITENYGLFIMAIFNFIVVAIAMFLLVQLLERLKRKKKAEKEADTTTMECPYCISTISSKASRCPNCTSSLETLSMTPKQ